MNKTRLIYNIIVMSIIFILTVIIVFKKEESVINFDSEKRLIDSLNVLQKLIDTSKLKQLKLEKAYDSLLTLEPIIIYKNNEKIKFIFAELDPSILDSIIRTEWKTKPRYN